MSERLDSMSAVRHKRGAAVRHAAVAHNSESALLAPPTVVVFSADEKLTALTEQAAPSPWKIERCEDAGLGRDLLSLPNVRLVIVDDETVQEDVRGWLLDRIRRFVPQALLIYIAASHTPDYEKRARGYAAQYYTAKPLDMDRTLRVLQSFVRVAADAKIPPSGGSDSHFR